MKSDIELQLELAKMLPEKIRIVESESCVIGEVSGAYWKCISDIRDITYAIKETEWLHVCHLIEQKLTEGERRSYFYHLFGSQRLEDARLWDSVNLTWQQRAESLIKLRNK